MRKAVLVVSIAVALMTALVDAQTRGRAGAPARPTTPVAAASVNDEIIKLVAVGMSEEVVLAFVAGTDKAKFDKSAIGLLKLKEAKVSDRVIAAIMGVGANAGSVPAATPKPEPALLTRVAEPNTRRVEVTPGRVSTRTASGVEAGIYWDNNGKLVLLEPAVFSGEGTGNKFLGAITSLAKRSIKAKVRSAQANQRIASPSPTFYFYFEAAGVGLSNTGGPFTGFLQGAASPNEFVLVRMKEEKRDRTLVTGESWAFSDNSGVRSKDVVDISFERLDGGGYRVVPKEPLASGEYCFFYAAGNLERGNSGKLFDFGVDASGT